ncbi:glycosyltransferase [Luminiphilus sp.]|nr:glycosyltransferase [Luminiphilus sp.]
MADFDREEIGNRRLKVAAVTVAISPERGSEYSVGWNYVTEVSKDVDLFCFYGLAGSFLGDLEEIDKNEKAQKLKRVRFFGVKANWFSRGLNLLNKKGVFPYAFYFAYFFWHIDLVINIIRQHKRYRFDVIHYVCPIGFREPGFLWLVGVPVIWGPIGGLENTPTSLIGSLDKTKLLFFRVKNLVNYLTIILSPRVRYAFSKYEVIYAANSGNQQAIRHFFKREVECFPENAVPDSWLCRPAAEINNERALKLVWIGSSQERKNLAILLEALVRVQHRREISISIIGDANENQGWRELAVKFGVDVHLNWMGRLPRDQVFAELSSGDYSIITSVMEGTPTTIWEAMAAGVPSIAFALCGMRDTLDNDAGVLIEATHYDQMVESLAEKLMSLPKRDLEMTQNVRKVAERFSWSRRRSELLSAYMEINRQ